MSKREEICNYLTLHPDATEREIAEHVGCHPRYPTAALQRSGRKLRPHPRGTPPLNKDGAPAFVVAAKLSHTEETWLRNKIRETRQPASRIIRELIRATAISEAAGEWK